MGSCLTNQGTKAVSNFFHYDLQLQSRTEIYRPLQKNLFNTLRKLNDLIVFQPGNNISINMLANTLDIDLETSTPNNLRMLLNFKKIVIVGDFNNLKNNIIKKIKNSTSVSKMYVVQQSLCNNFLKDYPIFSAQFQENKALTTAQIPIFAYDSKQLVSLKESRLRIYIHATAKKDLVLYKQIGIKQDGIIPEPVCDLQSNEQISSYYIQALRKNKSPSIILLHSAKVGQNDILQILTTYISEKDNIQSFLCEIYLQRCLPKATNSININKSLIEEALNQNKLKFSVLLTDSSQKYMNLFQKLQSQSNAQKTERAYNLLSKLIINIYSNSANQDSYRKVKKINKQIEQLLSRYKSGRMMLEEVGFLSESEYWVNYVQSKYLKIYKTDFDIGYKNYKNPIVISKV